MSLTTQNSRCVFALLLGVMVTLVFVAGASASPFADLPAPQGLPSDAVAVVVQPPAETQTITVHDFKRAMAHVTAQAGMKRTPSPGQNGYWKLKVSAMKNLLDKSWVPGQAAEMRIAVTPKQIATELAQIKKQNFKTEAGYKRFLKKFHYTRNDVNELVKLQLLSSAIQQRVVKGIESGKARRRAFTRFVAEYTKRWRSRTVCAPGYIFGRCSNARSELH